MKSISWLATCSARACSVALMPERRRLRSERSSSLIDIVIGVLLWVSLRVRLPERLVLGEAADGRTRLGEPERCGGRHGGAGGLLALERAPHGGVGGALGLEKPGAHRLDVGACEAARKIRQSVDRALSRAAHASEEIAPERRGAGADARHAREQPCGLARGVEQAIGGFEREGALAQRFCVPAKELAFR